MWIGNLMLVVLNLPMVGHLGEAAARAVPAAVSGDHRVLLHRRLHRQQQRRSTSTSWRSSRSSATSALKLDCEPAPLILGFVLGPMMEENLRRALLISRGDPMVFVQEPISLAFLIVALVVCSSSSQRR